VLFVLAANSRMLKYLEACVESLDRFGCPYTLYDLGDLHNGIPFAVDNPEFNATGVYWELENKRQTKAMFKPLVVQDALKRFPNDELVWIDVDTVMKKRFSFNLDFDIGVACRPDSERIDVYGDFAGMERIGKYNAGMIIFNRSEATDRFVKLWAQLTLKLKNDQLGLNAALRETQANIKFFPVEYNSPNDDDKTILYHIKGAKKAA